MNKTHSSKHLAKGCRPRGNPVSAGIDSLVTCRRCLDLINGLNPNRPKSWRVICSETDSVRTQKYLVGTPQNGYVCSSRAKARENIYDWKCRRLMSTNKFKFTIVEV